LLSELAQLFSDKQFRERLSTLTEPGEVRQLFAEWQPA
jgi:mannitol/fructose-specific phosphotransferase system IIA component (Ntr-type)